MSRSLCLEFLAGIFQVHAAFRDDWLLLLWSDMNVVHDKLCLDGTTSLSSVLLSTFAGDAMYNWWFKNQTSLHSPHFLIQGRPFYLVLGSHPTDALRELWENDRKAADVECSAYGLTCCWRGLKDRRVSFVVKPLSWKFFGVCPIQRR
jgi:hypothetical protein